jgi:hypothetical protein
MRGIDLLTKKSLNYIVQWKSQMSWHHLFPFFLDIFIGNTYIIYSEYIIANALTKS